MPQYYVPIENPRAPEAQRFFIHIAEAQTPASAIEEAREAWLEHRGFVPWAATIYEPTFNEMRMMRETFLACHYGRNSIVARVARKLRRRT